MPLAQRGMYQPQSAAPPAPIPQGHQASKPSPAAQSPYGGIPSYTSNTYDEQSFANLSGGISTSTNTAGGRYDLGGAKPAPVAQSGAQAPLSSSYQASNAAGGATAGSGGLHSSWGVNAASTGSVAANRQQATTPDEGFKASTPAGRPPQQQQQPSQVGGAFGGYGAGVGAGTASAGYGGYQNQDWAQYGQGGYGSQGRNGYSGWQQ